MSGLVERAIPAWAASFFQSPHRAPAGSNWAATYLADAMRHEYRAIVDAGLVLQLDSPDLALTWNCRAYADKSYADYRKLVELHVDVLNHALEGIPQDRVRLHLCWGNSEKPHVRDIPIAEIGLFICYATVFLDGSGDQWTDELILKMKRLQTWLQYVKREERR